MASQDYVYPTSWNGFLSRYLQSASPLHNKSQDNGIAAGEGTSSTTSHKTQEIFLAKVRPEPKAKQIDLGLWLLFNFATRHDEWEHLRKVSQGAVKIHQFGAKCSPNIIKRVCDILGSVLLLTVLLPLFALIAIAIKLDSSGPVFFRHHRVGKNGKHFLLWKFRSMKMNVSKYQVSPRSAVDARLTRVGRLIRRMSLDEIPQFINVLRGEMSIVGPRPEMPFIVARYHPIERERLAVTPGITGLWQISPARAFPIHENLQYDLHYIRNQNFVLDCAIILRTITAVLHGIGAV